MASGSRSSSSGWHCVGVVLCNDVRLCWNWVDDASENVDLTWGSDMLCCPVSNANVLEKNTHCCDGAVLDG
jgi:hypothetical protein